MKNIIVYITSGKTLPIKELNIQVDNSLDLGWKKEDIWIVTNLPYEHNGVKSIVVGDDTFFAPSPTVSKINGVLKLFEMGLIKDELYWLHDHDAYQVSHFTEEEVGLGEYDMGICNYGRIPMWAAGSVFFTKKALDVLLAMQNYSYTTGDTEQKALRHIVGNSLNPNEGGHPMPNRVKLMNISYNFTHINLRNNWVVAIKPLKVVHFHYTPEWVDFFINGNNRIGLGIITDRLRKFFYNTTIIYYSANIEDPVFEQKIIDNIITQSKGLPIISVTRKPTNLGKNICVGEQPICYSNSFKQLLIGLKEATTDFCIVTESDVLYPPEYFTFTPPLKDKPYRYGNVWVHFDGRDRFYRKPFSEGSQMCGREHWIKSIENILVNPDSWEPEPNSIIFNEKTTYSWTGKPVITFKTRNAPNFKTGYYQKEVVTELPYWGTAVEVREKYL